MVFLQKSSEATCPRSWFMRNTVPLSYTARSDDVTSGSVTFAGNSGHDAAIAPVTFAGTSVTMPESAVTMPESAVTFVRNTQPLAGWPVDKPCSPAG